MPCLAHMHVALARMAEPLRTHGAARRTHRITLAALLLASALTMASALPPWDVADDSSSAGHAARCGGNGQGQHAAIVVGEAACVGGLVRAPRLGQQHAGCSTCTASVAASAGPLLPPPRALERMLLTPPQPACCTAWRSPAASALASLPPDSRALAITAAAWSGFACGRECAWPVRGALLTLHGDCSTNPASYSLPHVPGLPHARHAPEGVRPAAAPTLLAAMMASASV